MEILQVNKKAEINLNLEGEIHPIICDIKNINADLVSLYCPPEYRDLADHLKIGQIVDISICSYSGIFMLQSIVKEKKLETIVLTYPREKERIQRREYFRVSIQRPVDIYYHDGQKDVNLNGKTIDISGGGVRFWTMNHVRAGFVAEITMHMQDVCNWHTPLKAKGRILYTKQHDSRFTSKPGYISVIKFAEIGSKDRQLIMKTCFNVQIEMKQKGIL